MRVKFNIGKFIQNKINALKGNSETFLLTSHEIFDFMYGDEEKWGEFIQDDLCDEDIRDIFSHYPWATEWRPEVDHFMPNFDIDIATFETKVNAINLMSDEYELCIDECDLQNWVDANPVLNGCYLLQTENMKTWFPITVSVPCVDSHEESEKIVSETNNLDLTKEITEETPLKFEEAAAWCLNQKVFDMAIGEFGFYWAGQANPDMPCASMIDLSRAILDEINQHVKLYVESDDDLIEEVCPEDELSVAGKRWMCMILEGTGATQWNKYTLDKFGLGLVWWAEIHGFYTPVSVCGWELRNLNGDLVSTEEWCLDEFWYRVCKDWGIDWAIRACENVNNSKGTDIPHMDRELLKAHWVASNSNQSYPIEVESILSETKPMGLNVEPIFTWEYKR